MVTNSGDLVGRVLGGCRLEKLVGQGGMSAVYLAQQMQPERHVAVKVLMPRFDISGEDYKTFLARFRREANIVAKLEHINIVPLYSYGEESQLAYLVMPYVGGGSLGDVLDEQGRLSLPQTFHYLRQAAAALDYAHACNVVHRDLKPSNFLLYPGDNRLVLADFGVARITGEELFGGYEAALTQTGVTPGTLAYMAPEMLQNARGVDHRVDIYALGIVLYQLLSGRLPFTGDLFALVNKQMEEALPPLHQRDPAIPASIDSVLRKATAKQRLARYSSASQFAADFRRAMSGDAVVQLGGAGRNIDIDEDVNNEVAGRGAGDDGANVGAEGEEDIARVEMADEGGEDNNEVKVVDRVEEDIAKVETAGNLRRLTDRASKRSPYTNTSANTQIIGTRVVTPPPLRDRAEDRGAQPAVAKKGRSKKWSRKIWLLLVLSVLLVIGLSGGGIWIAYRANIPSPEVEQAEQVIQQFYADLNRHDYHAAYNLFAPELQNRMSYDMFMQNYANAIHLDVAIDHANQNTTDNVNILATIHALRMMPRGEVTTIVHFGYHVIRRNGVWKIATNRRQPQSQNDVTLSD